MQIFITIFWGGLLFNTLFATEKCLENSDALEISHVKVANEEDYYYCFGFLHARDRGWQMDFFRRVAQGRNAEVLGFSHVKPDLMMRLLNFPKLASKLWAEMPQLDRTFWIKYAEGANEGMKLGKSAKEFKLANYQPEKWEPEHSILVLLLQAFDQTKKTFIKDYEEQVGVEKYGDKAIELFNFDGLPWHDTILHEGEYPKKSEIKTSQIHSTKKSLELWENFPSVFGLEAGSNNWVVSKNLSKNNNAILANDPHLNLKTPLYIYWLNLNIKDGVSVIGASLPGVPIIISGTNNKVSWGLTNSYINTADVAYIKDLPSDELETIFPLVWFKFGFLKLPFFFKSFKRTLFGLPILPLKTQSDEPLIMRWSGYWIKSADFAALLKLKSVNNVEEANVVLSQVNIPSWNYVFADNNGDIGFRVVGNAFKHTDKTPFGAVITDWKSYTNPIFLDPSERPHLIKPKNRDFIYTANHRHWPADSAFHGGQGYTPSFRGLRIHELLKNESLHDVRSFKRIQCDTQAADAKFFVPLLLQFLRNDSNHASKNFIKAKNILADWNFTTDLDCVACGLYRRWIDLLNAEWKTSEPGTYRLLSSLDKNPNLQKDVLNAFTKAIIDTEFKPWKLLHLNHFKHISTQDGDVTAEEWKFAPEIATKGDSHSVSPGSSKWNEKRKIYDHYSGSSMRMIIEMEKNKAKVYLSLPGKNRIYHLTKSEFDTDKTWQDWEDCIYSEVIQD